MTDAQKQTIIAYKKSGNNRDLLVPEIMKTFESIADGLLETTLGVDAFNKEKSKKDVVNFLFFVLRNRFNPDATSPGGKPLSIKAFFIGQAKGFLTRNSKLTIN